MTANQRSGFRANFGMVNVSPVGVTVLVEIFTADGESAPGDSSFTIDLEPFGTTQVNDILKRLTPGERDGLIIRAGVISSEGAILTYLTDVDNTTNDASYQAGFRICLLRGGSRGGPPAIGGPPETHRGWVSPWT